MKTKHLLLLFALLLTSIGAKAEDYLITVGNGLNIYQSGQTAAIVQTGDLVDAIQWVQNHCTNKEVTIKVSEDQVIGTEENRGILVNNNNTITIVSNDATVRSIKSAKHYWNIYSGATLKLAGCNWTYTGDHNGFFEVKGGAHLVIYNGTFTTEKDVIHNEGEGENWTVDIYGGNFSTTSQNNYSIMWMKEEGNCRISGGVFNNKAIVNCSSKHSNTLAVGYSYLVDNKQQDANYDPANASLKRIMNVYSRAKIGELYYEHLTDALKNVQNGQTIELLYDDHIDQAFSLNTDKNITIIGNNKKIIFSYPIKIEKGSLTLNDCDFENTPAFDDLFKIGDSGKLTIIGGNYKSIQDIFEQKGNITIYSGNFNAIECNINAFSLNTTKLYGGTFNACPYKNFFLTTYVKNILAEGHSYYENGKLLTEDLSETKLYKAVIVDLCNYNGQTNNCSIHGKCQATLTIGSEKKYYCSFEKAMEVAQNTSGSPTVTLLQDVQIEYNVVNVTKGDFILNLNGKKIESTIASLNPISLSNDGNLTIIDGTSTPTHDPTGYLSGIDFQNGNNLTIESGTFGFNPTNYVTGGDTYYVRQSSDKWLVDGGYVAQIGEVKYKKLVSAISNVQSPNNQLIQTISLLTDISDENITINNGKKFKIDGKQKFSITGSTFQILKANLTLQNVTVNMGTSHLELNGNSAQLTISSNTTIDNVWVSNSSNKSDSPLLTMSGGEITGQLCTYGQAQLYIASSSSKVNRLNDYGHSVIEITGGAFGNDVNSLLKDNYVAEYDQSKFGDAMYHVSNGTSDNEFSVSLTRSDGVIRGYTTFSDALARIYQGVADTKPTLKLLKDCEQGDKSITIPGGINATVIGGAYTLTLNNPITVQGTLSTDGGEIAKSSTFRGDAIIRVFGPLAQLTTNTNFPHAEDSTAIARDNTVSVNVEQGKYVLNSGICPTIKVSDNAKLSVVGGYVTTLEHGQTTPATGIEFSGGKWKFDPALHHQAENLMKTGISSTSTPDGYGWYTVTNEGNFEITAGVEGNPKYGTFESAITSLPFNCHEATIKVLDDYTTSELVKIPAGYTLTITSEEGKTLTLGNDINIAGGIVVESGTIAGDKTINVGAGGLLTIGGLNNANAAPTVSNVAVAGGTLYMLNGECTTLAANTGANCYLVGGTVTTLNASAGSNIAIAEHKTEGQSTVSSKGSVGTLNTTGGAIVDITNCESCAISTPTGTGNQITISGGSNITLPTAEPTDAVKSCFTITGGTFNTIDPQAYIDDTFYVNNNGKQTDKNGMWKVLSGCIAKIVTPSSTYKYTLLRQALSSTAPRDNEVVLTQDCKVGNNGDATLSGDGTVTLNTNGHTLEVDKDITVSGNLALVGTFTGNANFVANGGSITVNNADVKYITCGNNGTVTFTSDAEVGTLLVTGPSTINANGGECSVAYIDNDAKSVEIKSTGSTVTNFENGLLLRNNASATVSAGTYAGIGASNGATLNLTGGTTEYVQALTGSTVNISGADAKVTNMLSVENNATCNITNGTINDIQALAGSTVTISEANAKIKTMSINDNATCSITGGSYGVDPNLWVEPHYFAEKTGTSPYIYVVDATGGYVCMATYDDGKKYKYRSLNDAMAGIESEKKKATVTYEDANNLDVTSTLTVNSQYPITIDGMVGDTEKKVLFSAPITINGKLTLNRGVYKTSSTLSGSDNFVTVNNNGKLTVNEATINASTAFKANAIVANEGSQLNITGGEITGANTSGAFGLVVYSDKADVALSGGTYSGAGGSIAWGPTSATSLSTILDAGCGLYKPNPNGICTEAITTTKKYVAEIATVCNAIIPSINYNTMVALADLDFTNSAIEAFYAVTTTENDSAKIKLVPVTRVAKGTPLVIKRENGAGGYHIPILYGNDTEAASDNVLVACLTDTKVASTETDIVYLLGEYAHKAVFSSVDHNPVTVLAGRAYISVPYDFVKNGVYFDPEALDNVDHNPQSGIHNINAEDDNDAPAYNLSGQRVNSASVRRSIVIRNGRKYVVK